MLAQHPSSGMTQIRTALAANKSLIACVALFSAAVNLLMLAGPLFMLQVYDRVLVARSHETLLALFILVIGSFVAMGVLDYIRNRIMVRVGARFQARLETRVFSAALRRGQTHPNDPVAVSALRDLDAANRLFAAPVFIAIFDAPWAIVFFAAIFVFHTWLGLLALAGGAVLMAVTWGSQFITAPRIIASTHHQRIAERLADQLRDEADIISALGMRSSAFARWTAVRTLATQSTLSGTDATGGFSTLSRTFRLFLQSAMLALGAWVVLRAEMTPGAMIAASILMGRALAPIEQIIAGWPILVQGRSGWMRLAALLDTTPAEAPRTPLPRPQGRLEVDNLTIIPPSGTVATLRDVSFSLSPGTAIGIIGPSGSGKTTLARALCGMWAATGGTIRLDGARLDQYDPDVLGRMTGYLPQRVTLFDGTVAENIARLSPDADPAAIVAAAQRADAHRMILDLPDGYDTRLTQTGGPLSGGQVQRIGLARALYGNPVLLILDEPNSNLDHAGERALNVAIRDAKSTGVSVIVTAHHSAAITECETLLMLESGTCRALGPREGVLRATVRYTRTVGGIA